MKRSAIKRGKGFRSRDREPAELPSIPRELPDVGIPASPPRRGTYGPAETRPLPKEPKPVRSETYRRLVASLPCFECRIEGFSQAAHPNSGKAKGAKLSDLDCFPLCCDRPGVVGHHTQFDRYQLVPRQEMAAYEARAKEWTQQQVLART